MTATTSHHVSRRALFAGAAAAVPAISLGAGATAAHADGFPYHDAHGLRIIREYSGAHPDVHSVDFRVHTDKVRTFPPSFRVILPDGYETSGRSYPVLLLLHGGLGFFLDWSNVGGVIDATRGHDLIVVTPDGGAGSFYSNANFPLPGKEAAWETFILDQVLPFVHENFRTDPSRQAIAGLSMGGFGALALGQKYGDRFQSISAYSGPADTTNLGVAAVIAVGPAGDAFKYLGTTNLPGATWGLPSGDIQFQYNPMSNIERYRGKRIFLRTGTGPVSDLTTLALRAKEVADRAGVDLEGAAAAIGNDITEIVVHDTVQKFGDALTGAGIDHDLKVLDGRTHEWGLWSENLREDLPGIVSALG